MNYPGINHHIDSDAFRIPEYDDGFDCAAAFEAADCDVAEDFDPDEDYNPDEESC